ncbi:MAG: geranylgeranyl reductase family protein [Saprospiraceae bacterium]|jgi:geranylgeranyl reductase family protein
MPLNFDIAIIGAGPAGTTCALALKSSGLKVALIDKSTFPRDKICGDAIPSPSFKAIQQFAPELWSKLLGFQETHFVKTSKIIAPNGESISFDWVLKAYNCARLDFDNQLLDLVKRQGATAIFEGEKVVEIAKEKKHFLIQTTQRDITTKLVIGADGTNGVTAKKLGNFSINRNHHCAAVRAYYSDVKTEIGVNEFYILKDHLPGYFWIFPLPNGGANVGFGMVSKEIKNRKINLTTSLKTIIETTPILKEKFANATLEGKIVGYGLPLGSRKTALCGDGFMLCGDAGSLIDPLQGHGIDKAMWSGYLAAKQAMTAFEKQQFDAVFLKEYEQAVYRKFGWEFTRNYWVMRGLNRFSEVLSLLARFF